MSEPGLIDSKRLDEAIRILEGLKEHEEPRCNAKPYWHAIPEETIQYLRGIGFEV